MEFLYKVKDGNGRIQEAVAQAESPSALKARLSARGIDVVEIRPRNAGQAGGSMEKFLSMFETVKLKDMVVFSRQFSSMIGAGVAMLRTLVIMIDQCENKKL